MAQLSSKGILFGHQETLGYGVGWKGGKDFDSDVYRTAGVFPAVFGWDLCCIEFGVRDNCDGVSFEKTKTWVRQIYEKNGISTFSWHADNPAGGDSWAIGGDAVGRILPGGDLHGKYVGWLDHIAAFFGDLKDRQGQLIPIIFRPYHEQNGGWFWWGSQSCTPEEYISLWRFTFDYLCHKKQLHNIIWCFSPGEVQTKDQYLETWPGDDYVDILGIDSYFSSRRKTQREQTIKVYDMLVNIADEKNKIAAITETGLEAIPQADWWTKVLLDRLNATEKTRKLAWVLVWRNDRTEHHYAPYPGHISADDFKLFVKHPRTLFLSDMPPMYQ
jgi:mannan endo-1,4-beta-mannosidase